MSAPLITLAQISSDNGVLLQIEQSNKTILENFDTEGYTTNLHKWTAERYPPAFLIQTYKLRTPMNQNGSTYLCSDGIYREVFQYVDFCLGYELSTIFLGNLQSKIHGIDLSYSLIVETPFIIIGIHATLPPTA